MSRIFADNAHSIGNTPLVQINRIAPRGVTILARSKGVTPAIRSSVALAPAWSGMRKAAASSSRA